MDIKQKKMILNNYRHLERELYEKFDNYKEARSRLDGVKAQIIDDMPSGSKVTFDKMGERLAMLEDLEDLRVAYNKTIAERKRIEKAIEGVQDALLRRILVFRYIKELQWEAICMKMNYRWTQIHKLHSDALNEINLG